MTIDMYGDKVAEASALIREFAKVDYFHYFARDPESSLEAFIAMLDQAEEKGRQSHVARVAELEALYQEAFSNNRAAQQRIYALEHAAPSAPAVEQQSKINAELLLVARYALEYIDGIPKDIEVDASGFDRDWANSVVGRAKLVSPQVADTDKVREAIDRLPDEIMNLRCTRTMSHFATTDDMKLYKEGHRDARHAAVELVLSAVWGAPSHEVPADWKLVPVSITEDMHVAAVKAIIRSTGNDDCPPNVWKAMLAAAPVASMAAQAPVREVPGWQPIETAPRGAKGISFFMAAWGPEESQSVGKCIRIGDDFYAAGVFYCLGNKEKPYELREVKVQPTHWMPVPEEPVSQEPKP